MPTTPNNSYIGHYSKEGTAIPGLYNGMRVEVLNRQNELLFVADVQVMNEHTIELVRASELLNPEIGDPTPVRIRGFNVYENCGIHVDGTMTKLARHQDSAWLVRELDLKGKDAGRAFARRPIQAQAWVAEPDEPEDGHWMECRVVNASAGGVCFRMPEPLELRSKLKIRFRLRRGKEQPPLAIMIRRATDRGDVFEYGSEFVDLDSEVDTIITRTIIQLQLMQPEN